jgi:hypothetical protein
MPKHLVRPQELNRKRRKKKKKKKRKKGGTKDLTATPELKWHYPRFNQALSSFQSKHLFKLLYATPRSSFSSANFQLTWRCQTPKKKKKKGKVKPQNKEMAQLRKKQKQVNLIWVHNVRKLILGTTLGTKTSVFADADAPKTTTLPELIEGFTWYIEVEWKKPEQVHQIHQIIIFVPICSYKK